MFARIIFAIGILALLFGQVPRSVTVCLCTGEVGVVNVHDNDLCQRHALPKCDHCTPKGHKGCYLTTTSSSPNTAIIGHWVAPSMPALLPASISVIEAAWVPVLQPKPWFLLPRIREPDEGGHPLRAPPALA